MNGDEHKNGNGKWISQERALVAVCIVLLGVTGALFGVWTNRIEHAITRIDHHDQRFNVIDSRITIQEHETATIKERAEDRELRIRELERRIYRR